MMKEISTVLHFYHEEPICRVIVITSNVPKVFCAGADIKLLTNISYEKQIMRDIFEEFSDALNKFKKILIASVNGYAFGGGFELALACDFIIATENSKFGLPEVTLGLFPGLGGIAFTTSLLY